MDLASLAQTWPLPGPWQVTEFTEGANNAVWRVESPGAGSYVLRIYRNHANVARVRHELAVLTGLQAFALPFAVPAPIRTCAGEAYHQLATDHCPALAILCPLAPGSHPAPEHLGQVQASGAALGLLDGALARLTLPDDATLEAPTPGGDLRRRVGADFDLEAELRQLPIDAASLRRVLTALCDVEGIMPPLYAALPQQLIHGDYDYTNVLMTGTRVTAVLDFEFSARHLRIEELGPPFFWLLATLLGTGAEWGVLDAFGSGYTSQQPLLPEEIAALPAILRYRVVGSLMRRLVRFHQGFVTEAQIVARVAFTLEREDWLAANHARLLDLAHGWLARG